MGRQRFLRMARRDLKAAILAGDVSNYEGTNAYRDLKNRSPLPEETHEQNPGAPRRRPR